MGLSIPTGYARSVRWGALWTLAVAAPYPLYALAAFILGALVTGAQQAPRVLDAAGLEAAGSHPFAVVASEFGEGAQHIVLFVTFATLFAVLRQAWPVRAALILVFASIQMLAGVAKTLIVLLTFLRLGDAYVHAAGASKEALAAVANGAEATRLGLQSVDGSGVAVVLAMVSLLPQASRLPAAIRWVGWIVVVGLALSTPEGPTFFVALVFLSVWAALLGRWLLGLSRAAAA